MMKLIGYCNRMLNPAVAVGSLFSTLETVFGADDFNMLIATGPQRERTTTLNLKQGAEELERSNTLSFFKEGTVAVGMDNQAHGDRFFTHPHSTVEVDIMKEDFCSPASPKGWLSLTEALVANISLDIAVIIGRGENTADYYRTPFGCGIGLIKVFWINCFGRAYADLIREPSLPTAFFLREYFGDGCKAFVSAASYEGYTTAPSGLIALQKAEIGEDLFHRLPPEKKLRSGGAFVLNPALIFRAIRAFTCSHDTHWRRYQAKLIPEQYGAQPTSRPTCCARK